MPGKKVAILQSNYIPWKGYFDIIGLVDEFIVYDEVQYTKNDWRNRNRIKTPTGVQWLTIPVSQKKLSQKISETEVTFTNWGRKNWNAIKSNYSKAPFFKTHSEPLEEFYSTSSLTRISEINRWLINHICGIVGIETEISDSTQYNLNGDPTERLVSLCKQAGAQVYLSGPAAKKYLRTDLFEQEGLRVEWMDYESYPEYPQLYPPFVHAVSILDLIFNVGNNARDYMKFSNQ
ncbi:MAG TPA: WbqC family protein [Chryseosolibacter sp.]